MTIEKSKKDEFLENLTQQIKLGTIGLDHITYLQEDNEYDFSLAEVSALLDELYSYVWDSAMEDGVIENEEQMALNEITTYFQGIRGVQGPKSRDDILQMKGSIAKMYYVLKTKPVPTPTPVEAKKQFKSIYDMPKFVPSWAR